MLDYWMEALTYVKDSSDVPVTKCCAIFASLRAQVWVSLFPVSISDCHPIHPPSPLLYLTTLHSGIIALKRHLSRTKRHLCLSVLYNYDLHFLENRLKAWLRGMFESSAGRWGVGGVQAGGLCALVLAQQLRSTAAHCVQVSRQARSTSLLL